MTVDLGYEGGIAKPFYATPAGCKLAADSLRSFSIPEAQGQLSSIMKKAAWTTATSLGFLVVWVVLMVVRYRVLRRRLTRLVCDFVAALLAAVAAALFIIGSITLSSKEKVPYWISTYNYLADENNSKIHNAVGFMDQLPDTFLRRMDCFEERNKSFFANLTTRRSKADIKERATLIRDVQVKSFLYVAASSLAAIAAIFVLVSIISFILAACVKTVPLDTHAMRGSNSGVYTATNIHGRSLRTRMLPRGGRRTGMGMGDFSGRGGTGGGTISDMPATEAIEFFSRFIEKIPPPQDGVVMGRGADGTDCRICLEVLLEDIGRLSACGHTFHRRCILQWLLRADDPCCPLCKEPVKLCTAPYNPAVSTDDSNNHHHHHHHGHSHGDHNGPGGANGDVNININISDFTTDTDLDAEGLVNVDLQSQDSSIIPPAPISNTLPRL